MLKKPAPGMFPKLLAIPRPEERLAFLRPGRAVRPADAALVPSHIGLLCAGRNDCQAVQEPAPRQWHGVGITSGASRFREMSGANAVVHYLETGLPVSRESAGLSLKTAKNEEKAAPMSPVTIVRIVPAGPKWWELAEGGITIGTTCTRLRYQPRARSEDAASVAGSTEFGLSRSAPS